MISSYKFSVSVHLNVCISLSYNTEYAPKNIGGISSAYIFLVIRKSLSLSSEPYNIGIIGSLDENT